MKRSEKIKALYNHYGASNQMSKTLEELAELSLALIHFTGKKATHKDVLSELADVTILVMQLSNYFGTEEYLDMIDFKLDRQLKRIGYYGKQ